MMQWFHSVFSSCKFSLHQWRSQGLEVGWAQRVWGRKSHSGIQRQSSGGGLGAPPEARYAYTICSGQTHFHYVFIEDIRCTFRLMRSLLPPPPLLQKLFEFVQISRPTLAEVGWARAPPWLRHWSAPVQNISRVDSWLFSSADDYIMLSKTAGKIYKL